MWMEFLDRDAEINKVGNSDRLLFVACEMSQVFIIGWEYWHPPQFDCVST
jgi:hypothetical protein